MSTADDEYHKAVITALNSQHGDTIAFARRIAAEEMRERAALRMGQLGHWDLANEIRALPIEE